MSAAVYMSVRRTELSGLSASSMRLRETPTPPSEHRVMSNSSSNPQICMATAMSHWNVAPSSSTDVRVSSTAIRRKATFILRMTRVRRSYSLSAVCGARSCP
eukprot:3890207-Rhodomonas_salina.2